MDIPVSADSVKKGLCITSLVSSMISDSNAIDLMKDAIPHKHHSHHTYIVKKCLGYRGAFNSDVICGAQCLSENHIPQGDQESILDYVRDTVVFDTKNEMIDKFCSKQDFSLKSECILSAIWLVRHIISNLKYDVLCRILMHKRSYSIVMDYEINSIKEKGIESYLLKQPADVIDRFIKWANSQRKLNIKTYKSNPLLNNICDEELNRLDFKEGNMLIQQFQNKL